MRPPYHYGEYKWDKYLLDIQQEAREASEAAQQAAAGHLKEFRAQTGELKDIHSTLEEMRAEFAWGFNMIAEPLSVQIHQLSEIAEKLDEIHKTLRSPLLTQARELFLLGQEHYSRGLWKEALQAYLKSEQLNEVDFALQFQIGNTYLFKSDETGARTDARKAEAHLLLAARYANAEKDRFPRWMKYCGDAYFHAGVAAYLTGQEEQAAGRKDAMRSCLERALGHLSESATLWPQFADIFYTQAKCHALLGQVPNAVTKLEILSDRDRRYFTKASMDDDFGQMRTEVKEAFTRAIVSPGPQARAAQSTLDDVAEVLKWAKRSVPESRQDLEKIDALDHELLVARQLLPTLDVDIEGLNERLSQAGAEMEAVAQRSFQDNVDASQHAIASCEAHRTSCESSIERLRQTMKKTSGTNVGCVFGALFLLGGVVLVKLLGKPNYAVLSYRSYLGVVALLLSGLTVLGAVVGGALSRRSKNRPHRLTIEDRSRKISECDRTLVSLREQADRWIKEAADFNAWRMQRESPDPPTSL